MENTFSEIRVLSPKDKFVEGCKRFGAGFVKYCKNNWFTFIAGGLMILFLLLMIAPAASIRITRFDLLGVNLPIETEGDPIIGNLELAGGSKVFGYNTYNLIGGRAETLNLEGGTPNATYFAYFTFNIWLLLGLLFMIAGVVCIFVNRKTPRIVGACLAFVGAILFISFYQRTIGMTTYYSNSCNVDYDVTWNAGYYLLVIASQLIEIACIAICVYDLYRRHKHAESETERYMRGGK